MLHELQKLKVVDVGLFDFVESVVHDPIENISLEGWDQKQLNVVGVKVLQ